MKIFLAVLALFAATVTFAAVEPGKNWGASTMNLNNQSVINVTTISSLIYPANPNRIFLQIQNQSSQSTLTVKFGSSTVGSEGMWVNASTIYAPVLPPSDAIYMKSSGGVIPVVILEGI